MLVQHRSRVAPGGGAPPLWRGHARAAVGRRPSSTTTRGRAIAGTTSSHAVVLGAGMAGLVHAHVLAKHFERVSVLERDAEPPAAAVTAPEFQQQHKGARRGVTQYHHLHVLASAGYVTLDGLFEGRFTPALEAAGAVLTDVVSGFQSCSPAGSWRHPPTAVQGPVLMAQATRHCFERVTAGLLAQDANVEVLHGRTASGLVFEPAAAAGGGAGGVGAPATVTGVRMADGSRLDADLVVDCCGRCSATAQWLAAAGLGSPRVSLVDARLGYVSWLVKLDPAVEARVLQGKHGIYAISAHPEPVGGAVVRVEGGLHMAAVCTYGDSTPPFDDAQLSAYLQEYCYTPVLAELLTGSQQVSPASRFYKVSSQWRHYEEMDSLPEGLLVSADSVAAFNPLYGHGMTVAALAGGQLDALLSQRRQAAAGSSSSSSSSDDWLVGLPAAFQSAIVPLISNAWQLSVGGDLRFSSTVSNEPPSPGSALMNGYLDVLTALATQDTQVTETLLRVMHLRDPPSALLRPGMLGRAALHKLASAVRRGRGQPVQQQRRRSGDGGGTAAVAGRAWSE